MKQTRNNWIGRHIVVNMSAVHVQQLIKQVNKNDNEMCIMPATQEAKKEADMVCFQPGNVVTLSLINLQMHTQILKMQNIVKLLWMHEDVMYKNIQYFKARNES